MARRKTHRPVYWTRARVLARLRRAVREVYGNDETKLSCNMAKWRKDVAPFNEGYPQNRPLYPSPESLSRACGGLQKAWKALGYDVEVTMINHDRKYQSTPKIDKALTKIYQRPAARFGGHNFRDKGKGVKAYAAEIGWPHWVLVKRAQELGIARVKEKQWTKPELEALDELAHFTPAHIWRLFKLRGFKRSEASIACMRKKRGCFKAAPWYSSNSLATLMGVDQHMVADRWIPLGLQFIRKHTKRKTTTRQHGDVKLFHQKELRRFFVQHPEEIDLLKVDKFWFLEMITAGKIKQVVPSERLSIRAEAKRPVARAAKAAA